MVFTVIKNSNNFCTTCHHFLCKRNWISFGFLMKSTNYRSCDKQVNAMYRVCSSRGIRRAELLRSFGASDTFRKKWISSGCWRKSRRLMHRQERVSIGEHVKSQMWEGRGSLNGRAAHRCCGKRSSREGRVQLVKVTLSPPPPPG